MDQTPHPQQSRFKLIALVVAIVVIAGVVVVIDRLKNHTMINAQATSTEQGGQTSVTVGGVSASATASDSGTTFKDGTYSASSSYYVPHGNETIKVTMTVKSNVVSAVSIENSESDHDSAEYQESFASAYKTYVVGKKLADIHLGTVAGASDTVEGFNQATARIAQEAKA